VASGYRAGSAHSSFNGRVIEAGETVFLEVTAEDGGLTLRKVEPECALCGQSDSLIDLREKHLCRECVREIRLEPECAVCGRLDNLVETHGGYVCRDGMHDVVV